MFSKPGFTVMLVLALAVGIAACAGEGPATTDGDPAAVVQSFYDWYLAEAAFDPETQERSNPLVEGSYRDRSELDPTFVARLDEIVAGSEGMAADPLLCAQDVPEAVTPGEAVIIGDRATVPVTTSFAGHGFKVELQKSGGAWLMDTVACAAP